MLKNWNGNPVIWNLDRRTLKSSQECGFQLSLVNKREEKSQQDMSSPCTHMIVVGHPAPTISAHIPLPLNDPESAVAFPFPSLPLSLISGLTLVHMHAPTWDTHYSALLKLWHNIGKFDTTSEIFRHNRSTPSCFQYIKGWHGDVFHIFFIRSRNIL